MPQKCQKQAEAKRDGVINPQNYNFKVILCLRNKSKDIYIFVYISDIFPESKHFHDLAFP